MSGYADSEDDISAIVIDNGSSSIKAGWAGDEVPKCVFSTAVGRLRHKQTTTTTAAAATTGEGNTESSTKQTTERRYLGNCAQQYREMLSLTYPIQHGLITNWDDMEAIWQNIFTNELQVVDLKKRPILLTEPVLNPLSQRVKMHEIMFEQFDVPCVHVEASPVLSVYSNGHTTAMIVDVGAGVTQVVPVYEGDVPRTAIRRIDFGGGDMADHLAQMLHDERGLSFNTSASRETVREINEKLSYVVLDYESAMKSAKETPRDFERDYELPDKTIVKLGSERFRVGETLFNPSLLGSSSSSDSDMIGLHHLVHDSMQACDIDLRRSLYWTVRFTGGVSRMPGAPERLEKELKTFTASKVHVRSLLFDSIQGVWVGGSILASLSCFRYAWVAKQEYDEVGTHIVHRKRNL